MTEDIVKLGKDLELLEKEILTPEGYEIYDFGGGHVVAPNAYLGKDDRVHPIEGTHRTHMMAIYKYPKEAKQKVIFSAFEIDPEKYDVKDIADAFKVAIAEGREKYPDLA